MIAVEFVRRLRKVRRSRDGFMACCPAHVDETPSLSVKDVADRIVIHDFGGCSAEEIVAAVGLTLADLFFSPRELKGSAVRRTSKPQDEWQRAWTAALHRAHEAGRSLVLWEPVFSRADFVRHAHRLAAAYRDCATRMPCDDPAMWDLAELAVWVEDEARRVEHEADHLIARARR